MTERRIDAEYVLTLAQAVQEVALTPEEAGRMAALQQRFNDAVLGQRHRVAVEAEPADFARVLHQGRDDWP